MASVEHYPRPSPREFHFHVYFDETDPDSVQHALRLRQELLRRWKNGEFVAVPLGSIDTNEGEPRHSPTTIMDNEQEERVPTGVNMSPVGPHPTGSFETWVPLEHFASVYTWFLSHRGPLSVLVHPLTLFEVRDHTVDAVWMGKSYQSDLNLRVLQDQPSGLMTSQYPQLGLGYAASA